MSSYSYRGRIHETKKIEYQLVELRQFGSYVAGRVLATQTQSHTFRGRIKYELYFTGTWETDVKGEIYHGAFQFVLDVHGKNMKGKWIGFNKQHVVDSGDWEWRLVSAKIDKIAIEKCVADFQKQYGQADDQHMN
jgi:hypothetical protein